MKTLRLLLLLLTCAAGVRAATDITLYTGDYSTNTLGTNSIAIIVWDDGELGRIVRMSDSAFLTNMTARGFASTNLLESVSNVVASLAIANDTTTSNALRTTFVANDTTTSNALYSLIGSATSGTNFHHIRVTNDIYAAGSVLIPTMDADSVVITDSNKKLTTGPTTAAALALIANLSADAETRLDNLDGSTNALNAKTNFVNVNVSEGLTTRTFRATSATFGGSPTVTVSGAPTNNVTTTNLLGTIHQTAAATLTWDGTQGRRYAVTNRIGAATTVVVTNFVGAQNIRGKILGEASGGTSRVVTFVFTTVTLVGNLNDFSAALALESISETLTNGNALEFDADFDQLNGTNVASVVTRQFKF
jgi:hypothetical protein